MYNKIFGLLLLATIALGSCNGNTEKEENKSDSTQITAVDTNAIATDTISKIDSTLTKGETLSEAILAIIHAYTTNDNKKLNAYIDKEIGFYSIYRPGVQEIYVHAKQIDFDQPIPSYYHYSKYQVKEKLKFAKLPTYDCGKEIWSKKGLYCDNKNHPTELSRTAMYMNEFLDSKIADTEIQYLKQLESKSYRVILTEGDEPLIFHITRSSEKWILTVLDRAYGGCDA